MDQDEKCFACGKAFRKAPRKLVNVAHEDQNVFVGPECYARVMSAGAKGYMPSKGGPVLYLIEEAQ